MRNRFQRESIVLEPSAKSTPSQPRNKKSTRESSKEWATSRMLSSSKLTTSKSWTFLTPRIRLCWRLRIWRDLVMMREVSYPSMNNQMQATCPRLSLRPSLAPLSTSTRVSNRMRPWGTSFRIHDRSWWPKSQSTTRMRRRSCSESTSWWSVTNLTMEGRLSKRTSLSLKSSRCLCKRNRTRLSLKSPTWSRQTRSYCWPSMTGRRKKPSWPVKYPSSMKKSSCMRRTRTCWKTSSKAWIGTSPTKERLHGKRSKDRPRTRRRTQILSWHRLATRKQARIKSAVNWASVVSPIIHPLASTVASKTSKSHS